MCELKHIIVDTNYQVPFLFFEQRNNDATTIVILPAMGTAAKHYQRTAASLHDCGYQVVIYEQRGHGESDIRASHKHDWGYHDLLTPDLESLLTWIRTNNSGDIYLLGHSLGGHLSVLSTGLFPHLFTGAIIVAAGIPYHKLYKQPVRLGLYSATYISKVVASVSGYFPGRTLGFAGREAKTLIDDWSYLVRYNQFNILDCDQNLQSKIQSYQGPVLNIHYDRDFFIPKAANQSLMSQICNANIETIYLTEDDVQHKAGHFEWMQQPTPTIKRINQWLNATDRSRKE